MIRLAPTSTLFPYTTLFRSQRRLARGDHLGVEDLGVLEILHQRTPGDGQSAGIQQIPHLAQHGQQRSEEHTSELQSRGHLVCRLLLEKKKKTTKDIKHRISG